MSDVLQDETQERERLQRAVEAYEAIAKERAARIAELNRRVVDQEGTIREILRATADIMFKYEEAKGTADSRDRTIVTERERIAELQEEMRKLVEQNDNLRAQMVHWTDTIGILWQALARGSADDEVRRFCKDLLARIMARIRHKERQSEYRIVGEAEGQVSVGSAVLREVVKSTFGQDLEARPVMDGTILVVYRGSNGKLWWRFPDEMDDGRFEEVVDAAEPVELGQIAEYRF